MAVKLLFLLILAVIKVDSLKLEQVFILSRHNVRAPLSKNLQRTTPLEWPSWDVPTSYLTEKGRVLEGIMGEYFSHWLETNELFTEKCPDPESVLIYSNCLNRTIETGRVFARTAFKNCNISVHFNTNKGVTFDPLFAPTLRNTTDYFRDLYYRHMREKLNSLQLEDAYELLERIVDFKNSDICKHDSFCDFNMRKDDILFMIGEEPDVYGPLSIGNQIVDFFLMCYYNGRPKKDIAWGKIKTDDEWKSLLDITRKSQHVRFNQTLAIAKDLSKPLISFILKTFLNDLARKFTMLIGHDSNMNSIITVLQFKNYNLPGQYELWPVGGKLVFQKWRDENSKLFLKVEYIYASMKQLREGTIFTPENPPFSKVMELRDCEIDENGYCPWDDFVNILKKLH